MTLRGLCDAGRLESLSRQFVYVDGSVQVLCGLEGIGSAPAVRPILIPAECGE